MACENSIDTVEARQWRQTDRANIETKVMPIDDFIDAFSAMLKKLTIHDLTAKCRPDLFKRLRKTSRKVNTPRLQTFRRMILLLSILPTPYERSQESSEHQPRRRTFHASSPPQVKMSTDYKRDARADAFRTDRDHKPSHDRLAAIMLGFFGLLRVSKFTVPHQHGFNPDHMYMYTCSGAKKNSNGEAIFA